MNFEIYKIISITKIAINMYKLSITMSNVYISVYTNIYLSVINIITYNYYIGIDIHLQNKCYSAVLMIILMFYYNNNI
jgi:hypothetical protein